MDDYTLSIPGSHAGKSGIFTMIKFLRCSMINGIILQREENKEYKGVEGDNWYLNDSYPDSFEDYYCTHIEKSWYDSDYVDVCSDSDFIRKYMEQSRIDNIRFQMLLCETDKIKPEMKDVIWPYKFIGYDYAYSGGSYYSAVLNDVYSRRIEQFRNFELNSYGLFQDIEKLKEFMVLRMELSSQHDGLMLEKGDYLIYKLYEVMQC